MPGRRERSDAESGHKFSAGIRIPAVGGPRNDDVKIRRYSNGPSTTPSLVADLPNRRSR